MRVRGTFGARQRADHDVQVTPREFGWSVRLTVGGELTHEFLESLEPELFVGHFSSPETERGFDLHVLAQEIDRVVDLHFEVVGVDGGGELDLLHAIGVLVLFGLLFAFGEFIPVFAVVDQAADRGDRVGSNLNQIDLVRPSQVDGIAEWEYAQLLAVDADHTDFTGADFPVDPDEWAGGWRTEIGALQDTPNG